LRNVPGLETVYRDYAPQGVRFYYIYKSLAHPGTNGYVQPFTLQERLLHVKEAQRKLGSQIPWLCDTMANDLKHALGNANNSEFVIAPDGTIARLRSWSDPEQLRKALAELVGPVEKPTRIADLKMESPPPRTERAAARAAPRLKPPVRMQAIKVQPLAAESGDATFYVKLRAEADESALSAGAPSAGKVQLYLGFHLDPLYHVHWNNLVEPLSYEIKTPAGVCATPAAGQAPKVEQPSDVDPREFLVTLDGPANEEPLEVTVKYFACTETMCKAVTQRYLLRLERDLDAGVVFARSGGPGGFGGRFGRGDMLARALEHIALTEQQKGPVEKVRAAHQERMRKLFEQMRDGAIDREEMSSARGRLEQQLRTEMETILTAEQFRKFSEALSNGPRRGERPPLAPPPK